MKKFVIGCLSIIGGVVVISVIIAVITSIPSEPTPDQTGAGNGQSLIEVELVAAQNQGLIQVSAIGQDSLSELRLTLTSESDKPLEVTIPTGTVFGAEGAGVSSMVITADRVVSLEPRETVGPVDMDALSLDMDKEMPDEGDVLVVTASPASDELIELLSVSGFADEVFRIRQFTVWTLIHDPLPDEYTGIIGTRIYPTASGPSQDELAAIRSLFEQAGIESAAFQALMVPIAIGLLEARAQGLIEISATGAGNLESIKLTVTSKSDEPLELAILPGTIFAAQSASTQSMVVTTEKVVLLYPYQTEGPISLNAACSSMRLDVPGSSDSLTLQMVPVSEDLIRLLNLSAFHSETFRVRQFAIWTITDNPIRGGYVGIGTFGFGSGPNDEEMARIRSLFEKAGIDTDKYRALG